MNGDGGNDVVVGGCFDVLHVGHLAVFRKARELAGPWGTVTVALNSDESVRRLKGPSRPVNRQDDRAAVLMALRDVDDVQVFDGESPRRLLESLRPDFFLKGGDYRPEEVVEARGVCPVVIVPLVEGKSTTATVERMKKA